MRVPVIPVGTRRPIPPELRTPGAGARAGADRVHPDRVRGGSREFRRCAGGRGGSRRPGPRRRTRCPEPGSRCGTGLAAVLRVREHVVDHQDAAGGDPRRPALVVGAGRLVGVPAVDEQQRQRAAPERGDVAGAADDRGHLVLQPGAGDGAPELAQRVQLADLRVHQGRVVVLPAGLVLLGATVVVDRDDPPSGAAGRRAEVDRGLAAVGADLHRQPGAQVLQRGLVERLPLVGGHEAGGLLGQLAQLRRDRGVLRSFGGRSLRHWCSFAGWVVVPPEPTS